MGSGTVEFYSVTRGIVHGMKDFLTNCWVVRIKLSGCLIMPNKQCLHLKVGLWFYQRQWSGYSKLGSSCWFPGHISTCYFICWLLHHWKLPTLNSLQWTGILVQTSCLLRTKFKDTSIHLYSQCLYSMEIWKVSIFYKNGTDRRRKVNCYRGLLVLLCKHQVKLTCISYIYHISGKRNRRVSNHVEKLSNCGKTDCCW